MSRNFLKELTIKSDRFPLFEKIRHETVSIFIWGTGALAISVYKYCKNFGIKVSGCFVDVPVTDTQFEGMPILTLEELTQKYPRFSVIIGHANYATGVKHLKRIKNIVSVYCIPSCDYQMWNITTTDFLKSNSQVLQALFDELQDEESKQCLKSYFES